MKRLSLFLLATLACGLLFQIMPSTSIAADAASPITIMPIGDSITQGSGGFFVYRYPLMQKLLDAGYNVKYVGTQTTGATKDSPLGVLPHEGRGGNSVHDILVKFEAGYREFPADIVLIHTGHNQDSANSPVPRMIKSTRTIIEKVREINPKVTVLVAQVITSGKLPKYNYIPDYNKEVEKLATELNTKEQPVICVNMAEGWNVETDTVGDKVHPSKAGGEKMAQKWFDALVRILPPPAARPAPVSK
ncbi:MAG: GDSL-type esterase/lipase family protein [Candidatus Methylacidiphilales bacterium]|nr:GDSL-type esterase/lipase family protein [Candidatus Methylacidiphilales bacterium]